jgi:hypothetical protein
VNIKFSSSFNQNFPQASLPSFQNTQDHFIVNSVSPVVDPQEFDYPQTIKQRFLLSSNGFLAIGKIR